MTTKRTIIEPNNGITPDEASEAGRVLQGDIQEDSLSLVPPEEREEKPKLYSVGTWKGLPRWQCGLCPWDTLEGLAAMMEHIRERHTAPAPRIVRRPSPILDRFGNPIMVNEEA